jgi:hypothetical protein
VGGDLRALPAAGDAPLIALIPPQAEGVLALRDPAASLEALEANPAWKRLSSQGWLRDSIAIPQLERWRTVQSKLSELARLPLPGPEALLETPAVLAWVPSSEGHAGGWLYATRTDARASASWAMVRALNSVRSSGREVEIDRMRGVPVREIFLGAGVGPPASERLTYAVLADRLLIATDPALLSQALAQALGADPHSLATSKPFADLEARAASAGFAVSFVPQTARRRLPGVQALELDGAALHLQLDPAIWADSRERPEPDPAAVVRLGLPGLDLSAAFARLRLQLGADASTPLLQRVEAVAKTLGRGVFVQLIPWAETEEGIAVAIDGLHDPSGSTTVAEEAVSDLAAAMLDQPRAPEPIPGGVLRCSAGDQVCLASCEGMIRLAWPGSYLRRRGCPAMGSGSPSELTFSAGDDAARLSAELHEGRGQLLLSGRP